MLSVEGQGELKEDSHSDLNLRDSNSVMYDLEVNVTAPRPKSKIVRTTDYNCA